MKNFKIIQFLSFIALLIAATSFLACEKEPDSPTDDNMVDVGDHELFTVLSGEGGTTVVFESGLGNNYQVWNQANTLEDTDQFAQTLAYNRAGYAPSTIGSASRTIEQTIEELHEVITQKVTTEQIILVGHSWGGPIIRAYAIQYPEKVAGMLFIDPTHEDVSVFTQEFEDAMVASWGPGPGKEEAEQFMEGLNYLADLPNLPDVPVTVLTAMKVTADLTAEDRQEWYDAHDSLGEGLSQFQHIGLENNEHYIQLENPGVVLDAIRELVEK